jgi:integrase/recombinase XerD
MLLGVNIMISRNKATVKIVLAHKSKKSKIDGKQPIKLRIIHNRKPKYYALGFSLFEDEFNRMNAGQVRGELYELKIKLQIIEAKAIAILAGLEPFSISKFEEKFFRPRSDLNNAIQYLNNEVERAKKEGRISSKIMAECSLNSFKTFSRKSQLSFNDITIEWLQAYENFMIRKGNSTSTVGMYLRGLRVVYNKAIGDGVVSQDQYPFGKGRYEIPIGRNIKKALENADIKKILEYAPNSGSKEDWAKDMWLFIYLCNGINPKDIANLKYKDIDNDFITFIRSKTRSSRKLQRPIIVPINAMIKSILNKWGNSYKLPHGYVFNILKPGLTPEQVHVRVHDFYSDINSEMKNIARKIGLLTTVTTYVARHSFATVMKRNGASLEFISESLGHSDIRTTESYLASFDLGTKRAWADKLLDLK